MIDEGTLRTTVNVFIYMGVYVCICIEVYKYLCLKNLCFRPDNSAIAATENIYLNVVRGFLSISWNPLAVPAASHWQKKNCHFAPGFPKQSGTIFICYQGARLGNDFELFAEPTQTGK